MSKDDRIKYDSALRHYRDTISVLQGARDEGLSEGLSRGRAEGLSKGRAEGLSKGRAEGLSKGRAEGRADVARQMKSAGLPVAQIMEFTGLTAQQIARL